MKKIIILISLFCFVFQFETFSQVGQKDNDTLLNYVDINKMKQGKWKKTYKNGKTRYTGQFVNDIPYGEFYFYYENGKPSAIHKFIDQTGSCNAELFYENGKPQAGGIYNKEHKRINLWKIYYDSGQLAMIINYDDKGVLNGDYSLYYPDSKSKVMDCTYKNGKLNGKYIKYFKNGKTQEDGFCENNLRHGYWKFYNPDGLCEEEGNYVHGKREGKWKVYDIDDKVFLDANYKNGQSDLDDIFNERWQKKYNWAKDNQDKFKDPMEYLDNPDEFFR